MHRFTKKTGDQKVDFEKRHLLNFKFVQEKKTNK